MLLLRIGKICYQDKRMGEAGYRSGIGITDVVLRKETRVGDVEDYLPGHL